MNNFEITTEDFDKLLSFAIAGMDGESQYPGMSYEDGIRTVLDVLEGNITIDEATQ